MPCMTQSSGISVILSSLTIIQMSLDLCGSCVQAVVTEGEHNFPFSPRIPPPQTHIIIYHFPPPLSIGHQSGRITASGINWNWSKVVGRVKMKSHVWNSHMTRSACSYTSWLHLLDWPLEFRLHHKNNYIVITPSSGLSNGISFIAEEQLCRHYSILCGLTSGISFTPEY
jgi:hypothetical protein